MSDFLALVGTEGVILSLTCAVGIGLCAMTAWRTHTPESLILAEDVNAAVSALGKHGLVAADIFGIKPQSASPRLSRALRMGEPLNLWRLAALHSEFWLTFCARVSARHGAVLFTPTQAELLCAAARVGQKPMARMGILLTDAVRRQA